MKIKRFGESSEVKTFQNTQPHELALMDDKEIIDLISNTFPSKLVSSDPKWIVIESDWKHIDNDGNQFTNIQNQDLIGKIFKVYFHIFREDFLVIRGSLENLENFLELLKSKFPGVKKSGGTEGHSMIIRGRMFPNLIYALAPIPKNKDFVRIEGEYYSLNSMSCSTDVRIENKSIAYFSNLMIGSTIEQDITLKRDYPGMTKVDALKKSIRDQIEQNPDLKHLK